MFGKYIRPLIFAYVFSLFFSFILAPERRVLSNRRIRSTTPAPQPKLAVDSKVNPTARTSASSLETGYINKLETNIEAAKTQPRNMYFTIKDMLENDKSNLYRLYQDASNEHSLNREDSAKAFLVDLYLKTREVKKHQAFSDPVQTIIKFADDIFGQPQIVQGSGNLDIFVKQVLNNTGMTPGGESTYYNVRSLFQAALNVIFQQNSQILPINKIANTTQTDINVSFHNQAQVVSKGKFLNSPAENQESYFWTGTFETEQKFGLTRTEASTFVNVIHSLLAKSFSGQQNFINKIEVQLNIADGEISLDDGLQYHIESQNIDNSFKKNIGLIINIHKNFLRFFFASDASIVNDQLTKLFTAISAQTTSMIFEKIIAEISESINLPSDVVGVISKFIGTQIAVEFKLAERNFETFPEKDIEESLLNLISNSSIPLPSQENDVFMNQEPSELDQLINLWKTEGMIKVDSYDEPYHNNRQENIKNKLQSFGLDYEKEESSSSNSYLKFSDSSLPRFKQLKELVEQVERTPGFLKEITSIKKIFDQLPVVGQATANLRMIVMELSPQSLVKIITSWQMQVFNIVEKQSNTQILKSEIISIFWLEFLPQSLEILNQIEDTSSFSIFQKNIPAAKKKISEITEKINYQDFFKYSDIKKRVDEIIGYINSEITKLSKETPTNPDKLGLLKNAKEAMTTNAHLPEDNSSEE